MTAFSPSQPDRSFHGLWSLCEMIEFKIKPFLDVQDVLVSWSALLHAGNGSRFPNGVSLKLRNELRELLAPLMEQLKAHEFDMCRQGCERLVSTLTTNNDPGYIVSAIDDLRRRLLDQGELTSCLSLSSRERDLYEPRDPIFGKEFQTKFPSGGAFELDEAAKCLALSRPTAGVFHLMRLMEIGIRATGRCLNIADPIQPADRSWGAVLKRVRDGIDAKWSTVTARDSGDGATFDALYASLDAVKNPWRNATMHPANKYTDTEGGHIFDAVRGFMMRLASRCDENGAPKA